MRVEELKWILRALTPAQKEIYKGAVFDSAKLAMNSALVKLRQSNTILYKKVSHDIGKDSTMPGLYLEILEWFDDDKTGSIFFYSTYILFVVSYP